MEGQHRSHSEAPASSRLGSAARLPVRGGGLRGRRPLGAVSTAGFLLARVAGLTAVAAVIWMLAACGPVRPTSPGPVSARAVRTPGADIQALGPADPSRVLNITLVLPGQSGAALDQTLAGVADPASPSYRHFLTPEEVARLFGASPQAQARVVAALQAGGLSVDGRSADGTLIRARGSVRRIEALFGVRILDYRAADGRRFYAATSAPHLPASLQGAVTGVLGLESYSAAHSASRKQAPRQTVGYTPSDLQTAYDITPLRRAGTDGTGQTIALAEIDTFKRSDIATYDNAFGINAPAVSVVNVGQGAAPADKESETTLDIEVLHAIAPAAQVTVYEGGSDTASLAQMFSQIVSDHRAQVMSISLGLCERFILSPRQAPGDLQSAFTASGRAFFSSLDTTFREAGALGMSVLVATGDTGAYGCNQLDPANHELVASAPATSPYVTAVGGTALFTGSGGAYQREYGWEGPLEGAGGGGGVSQQYSLPSWQTGPGVSNQYSNGMRQVPDVSADADPLTGYAIYDSTSSCSGQDCWVVVGGTSAAAPLWAGLITLANQTGAKQGLRPLGFLNPALYRLGAGTSGPAPFHDVTAGGNLYYPATPKWDFSTGWGSPDGNALVQALLGIERGS